MCHHPGLKFFCSRKSNSKWLPGQVHAKIVLELRCYIVAHLALLPEHLCAQNILKLPLVMPFSYLDRLHFAFLNPFKLLHAVMH